MTSTARALVMIKPIEVELPKFLKHASYPTCNSRTSKLCVIVYTVFLLSVTCHSVRPGRPYSVSSPAPENLFGVGPERRSGAYLNSQLWWGYKLP